MIDVTPTSASPLADRYLEIRRFRSEGLARYGASEISVFAGPPVRVSVPFVGFRPRGNVKKRLGPLAFVDRPPVIEFVEKALRDRPSAAILEIGPGDGGLCRDLRARFGSKIRTYHALDRDPSIRGEFVRAESIDTLPDGIDLVIASEVIEHMTADDLFAKLLIPLHAKLAKSATIVISTPNPTAPGGIGRDFTHVQRYPWYDLYALFRLAFENVDVYRNFYAYEAKRIALLLPRIALCGVLELEWCDGLVCVASMPK
jgi:hypothetical protein